MFNGLNINIYPILLTYNNKMVHSSTGLTPNEARKPQNELTAYLNMTLKAKHIIKYPEIKNVIRFSFI